MNRRIELQWPQRPRIENRGGDWKWRIWVSKCRGYRVVHSHCLLGQRAPLSDIYYATRRGPDGRWDRISQHRVLKAAQEACRKHASREARK